MAGLRAGILSAPPIWEQVRTGPESLVALAELVQRNLGVLFGGTLKYLESHSDRLLAFALIACALFVLALQLRRMARATTDVEGTPGITLRRPFLVLTMLWMLLGPELLLPELDAGLVALRAGLVMGLLAVLLPEFVVRGAVAALRGLLLATFLVMAERALLGDPLYGRLLSLSLALVSLWLFRLLRKKLLVGPIRKQDPASFVGMSKLLDVVSLGLARVAPLVLLTGFLVEAVGAEQYGNELTSGVLYLATMLAAWIAADMLLQDAVVQIVHGPATTWLRAVRNHPEEVTHYSLLVFRVLLALGFVAVLPNVLPPLQSLWRALSTALTTPLGLGAVGLSFGDVLVFVVSVVLAVNAARLVRFLLREDVVSRLPLSAATASAVTRLAYYGIMIAGVLFAFAAAGLKLSQLTMVVSALSVGIGFGLQDIVKNFVSGLVIAFEHPFREGDVIATGQVTGRLQEIGLRASRIRTAEGAEVTVPNASLISTEVTNWTLSDRARRIEILVGVDYDSEPRHVLEVLTGALVGHPGLSAHPEPVVLFQDFAPSSLNFSVRAWTPDVDDRLLVESETRVRIFAALREAGIGIPFPQLDLHLRDTLPGMPPEPQAPPPVAS
ncbi:MAG: mechanosensitive ion channel domain-containing protein [Gammaproteobacteria bacterium]